MSHPVLFHQKKEIGIITLNASRTLNCLTLEMCQKIFSQLKTWMDTPTVKCVLINSSSEKALCAGGDVITLQNSMVKKSDHHIIFFNCEYEMDLMIHQYPKPIVVLASGIVMGGGVGITYGASHRVVTETTLMAMPEITIGFFPDVGGSYFLPRMTGYAGRFLGLTGCRLNGTDALYLGMADYLISTDLQAQVEETLFNLEFTDNHHQDIKEVLDHFHQATRKNQPEGQIEARLPVINTLVNSSDPIEIKKKLQDFEGDDPWLARSIKTCLNGSPTSFAVIIEQLQRGRDLNLSEVFDMEKIMAKHFGENHDMKEGIRALLIDKDKNPSWKPKTLEEVDPEVVQSYFP